MNIEDVKKWRKGYANGVRSEAAINWLISEHERLAKELSTAQAERDVLKEQLSCAYANTHEREVRAADEAYRQGAEAMRETATQRVAAFSPNNIAGRQNWGEWERRGRNLPTASAPSPCRRKEGRDESNTR